ncbi:MAG TPA: DUF2855 family protein [Solirubrobacteraceae bacterium]|nr:DUF2855 family protein [Solirubrobacteraceae bacterium]
MDFQVAKDELHRCRFLDSEPQELLDGQARLRVDGFGLSANNITYAKFGEAMSYWSFFPAEDGWGRVPVWGFAEVSETRRPELEVGTRVYGYLPPSSELVLDAARVDARGFIDASPHRARLPPTYNSYARASADPIYDERHEDEQMLLRPLFFTSYLIDDFLDECELFGAGTVVLSSASSKTASALAFLLSRRDGAEVVGLTSARSVGFVEGLGVYDHVVPYEQIGELPSDRAVYVDMAGDASVRDAVHGHYREQLAHSAVVGATHHDRMGELPEALSGPRPMFFFAPDRASKRAADWGREGLEQRLADAWRPYLEWTGTWLEVLHGEGPEAVEAAYLELLDGRTDPAKAHILSLPR